MTDNAVNQMVDVLLPIRAPAPWLEETLTALICQDFPLWNLMAVIHGDAPVEVALVQRIVPDATLIYVPSERTLVDVLNEGLVHCTADLVARIDADDVPHVERLKLQASFLKTNSDVALVASPVRIINEQSDLISTLYGPTTSRALTDGLRWKNVIAHPSVMFRRVQALEVGGYDRNAKHAEDYCLWLEIGAKHELGTLEIPQTDYRLHPGQVTQTKVIGRVARKRVLQARIAYARGRNESVFMARLRH